VLVSEVAMQQQIDDLKQELALALQSRDVLQAQLTARIKRDSKCYFLETIPVEVRIEIYKYLLINPILGKPDCIHGGFSSRYGSTLKYELTPGVLGTCHQIYLEASPILYGQNTILIACVEAAILSVWRSEWIQYINLSPLTRYCHDGDHDGETMDEKIQLEKIPAFARVKNWKILVSRLDFYWDNRFRLSWNLFKFCRAICHSAPDTIELAIIPSSMEEAFTNAEEHTVEMYALLAPLKILRRVGNLLIRAAEPEDLRGLTLLRKWEPDDPDTGFNTAEDIPVVESWDLPTKEAEDELVDLVTGDSPVELLFEMYRNLLTYAQTFERIEALKLGMGLDPQKRFEQYLGSDYKHFVETYDAHKNPFEKPQNGDQDHPVEQALCKANQSAWRISNPESSDYEAIAAMNFGEQRAMVLNFLDPQYKQIVDASNHLNMFIKEEKVPGGLFDANADRGKSFKHPDNSEVMSLGLVFLDEYAKSFQRHSPPEFRAKIIRQSQVWAKDREELPREQGLTRLHQMFESQDFTSFVEVFRFVCDDLDAQYLEIRKARRELFAWDIEDDKGCEIDLELNRCDEMVDWAVNEPVVFPQRLPETCEYSFGNFGWGWGR
jgi:hypothetical protein